MRSSNKRTEKDLARPADIALAGYELLRLRPARWRRVVDQLAAPVMRLHRLRNARTLVWEEAFSELDCGERYCPEGGSRE